MCPGCTKTKRKPADWTKDSPELKRERSGYWLTGLGTGPDTTCFVLWLNLLTYIAARDAACYPHEGLSSGADGQKCSLAHNWNVSWWNASGGEACARKDSFGDMYYAYDPALPGCIEAFATYRAGPENTGGETYTCNCTGNFDQHAFLGENGLRPSTVGVYNVAISQICVALLSPIIGSWAEFSDHRLKVWWWMTGAGVVSTLGCCIIGPNLLWVAGFIFSILTVVFTELQIPIRSSYLEDVAFDDATRGYVGGMRQFTSYSAQVLYAVIVGGCQVFGVFASIAGSEEGGWTANAIFATAVCGVWFGIFMPVSLLRLRAHPAKRTDPSGRSMVVRTFAELRAQCAALCSSYPEAAKYLLAHTLCGNGGPVMVTLITAYGAAVLERSSFYITIIALAVLLVGITGAQLFAQCSKRALLSFKQMWAFVFALFIAIGILVPVLATGPDLGSYIFCVLLAGVFGAYAFSWFYSMGFSAFISLVPPGQAAAYNGIFVFSGMIVQWVPPAIYGAVVQGTNNHRAAWATIVPWSVMGFVVMMLVDFDKGRRDAGHEDAVAEEKEKELELENTAPAAAAASSIASPDGSSHGQGQPGSRDPVRSVI